MFFRVVYFHWPNEPSRELEVIQCLTSFADSRRSHRESWALTDHGRIPATIYFCEAPEECATLLKLKGYMVTIFQEEPSELKSHVPIFIPDLEM